MGYEAERVGLDLERQAGRVLTMCSERGIRIDRTVTEIESGLDGRAAPALAAQGRTVMVLDDAELPEDLARDLTDVVTSMCARLPAPGDTA